MYWIKSSFDISCFVSIWELFLLFLFHQKDSLSPLFFHFTFRDSGIKKFFFCKFHWVCRHVGRTPRIIKKMMDNWKTVLGSRRCQNCIDGGSWVSLALPTWLRNYKVFYFGSFTEFDVMLEECPELSRKWRTFGKTFKL